MATDKYPNKVSNITPLTPSSSVGDDFNATDDHDWVPIKLVAGQSYSLTLSIEAYYLNEGIDPDGTPYSFYQDVTFAPNVAFRNSSGAVVSIPGIVSYSGKDFTFKAPKSGVFYVDISQSYLDNISGVGRSYAGDTAKWNLVFNKFVDKYAGDISTIGQLVLSSDNLHAISSIWDSADISKFDRPDADWFKTSLQAGQSYTIALASTTNAELFSNNLSIVDSNGKIIQPAQASNDSLSFIAPHKGTYYINAHLDKAPLNSTLPYSYILLGQKNAPVGSNQHDVLKGGVGADLLYGRAGNDTLIGAAGNDILNGGAGQDTMVGGIGNDTYYVDNIKDVVRETSVSGGTDSVFSSVSYTLPSNVENLTLQSSSLYPSFKNPGIGTGNQLNNVLSAGFSAVILKGGAGNDTLICTNKLFNGAAFETPKFFGETGNDTLVGYGHLVGGIGKDLYTISHQANRYFETTVEINQGDSLPNNYDVVKGFGLVGRVYNFSTLDLKSNNVASNVASANGKDVGVFHSHHITQGLISFSGLDTYQKAVPVAGNAIADAIKYLEANITTLGDTVAFVAGHDTYVFQDGGAVDTLVQLVGVTATGIGASGPLAKDMIFLA